MKLKPVSLASKTGARMSLLGICSLVVFGLSIVFNPLLLFLALITLAVFILLVFVYIAFIAPTE